MDSSIARIRAAATARRRTAALAATGLLFLSLAAFTATADTYVVDAACTPPVGCDCNQIQPCIEMAAPGDTVLVLPGVYTAEETRQIDVGGELVSFTANVFMTDGVHVIAEEPGDPPAVIDAGGTGVGVIADQVGSGTTLKGFVIRNGNASGSGFNSVGGGMLCLGSNVTVESNIFMSNQATQGGGLACETGSSPMVDGNVFEGNTAATDGGAIFCLGGAATISGNVFDSNSTGDVGAAIRYVAAGEIRDNIFRDNRSTAVTKGAIVIRSGTTQGTSVVVNSNLFHDNDSAIFMRTAPATELGQNTIIRCGAGIVDLGTADTVTITNNLIVSNQGSGVEWSGAPPIVTCNDVWQNAPNYAGIPDPTDTNGNISRDPLHCDPAQDDFTLHENSPCASANAGPCVLIGKFDAACPPSAVEPASWGRIKGAFGR